MVDTIGSSAPALGRLQRTLTKVAYYCSKYASLREGIYSHAVRIDSSSVFDKFLSSHPVDFAFVCIDQQKDSDSPRQDIVYAALTKAKIPFIDSGVSITLEDYTVVIVSETPMDRDRYTEFRTLPRRPLEKNIWSCFKYKNPHSATAKTSPELRFLTRVTLFPSQ